MKNILNIKTLFFVAIASFIFTSCTDDDYQKPVEEVVTEPITAGTADFSTYVAVGNSLTAGYTDGALFMKGQEMSMPNLVSKKFALIGGGSFTQPLMADNNGGFINKDADENYIQNQRLYFDGSGPELIPNTPTTDLTAVASGPFNNMGVPGAKVTHLLYDGYGNMGNLLTTPPTANPYYVRMASSSSATVLGDAISQNPTFFSLWIGANDVLRYALSGGESDSGSSNYDPITPSTGALGVGFDASYNYIVDALTVNGAKGVILNLPDITAIPHFTTVPYAPFDPNNPDQEAYATQIPTLNGMFGPLNQAFVYLGVSERSIVFSETEPSAAVIKDENLVDISTQLTAVLQAGGLDVGTATVLGMQFGQARQATENDLFVLPSKPILGQVDTAHKAALMAMGLPETNATQLSVSGLTYPLADKWVLLPSEQAEIQTATDAFNTTIQAAADAKDLAFIDVNSMMNSLANGGIPFDEFNMTSQYIFGNMFSLDGVHPTERGNAFIANEILKAIDAKYGSNFEASGNLNKAKDFVTQYPATIQ